MVGDSSLFASWHAHAWLGAGWRRGWCVTLLSLLGIIAGLLPVAGYGQSQELQRTRGMVVGAEAEHASEWGGSGRGAESHLRGLEVSSIRALTSVTSLPRAGQVGSGQVKTDDGNWQRRLLRFDLQRGVDVVGSSKTVEASAEDTLLDIAMRHAIGYEEIILANPQVDIWLPGEGTNIHIPSRFVLPDVKREGIVINLAEMRLYYFPAGEDVVETFPVSIGRMDWSTPLGETVITEKIANPAWYPPSSIREQAAEQGEELPARIPPGPDNPLGKKAMLLDIAGYLVHGTNRPWGIGMRATHGCIRLHPHDIKHLFGSVERGTRVKIINRPFKAGWSADGELYLQAFPLFEESRQVSRRERLSMAADAVVAALGERRHRVQGDLVRAVAAEQTGDLINISRTEQKWPLRAQGISHNQGVEGSQAGPEG